MVYPGWWVVHTQGGPYSAWSIPSMVLLHIPSMVLLHIPSMVHPLLDHRVYDPLMDHRVYDPLIFPHLTPEESDDAQRACLHRGFNGVYERFLLVIHPLFTVIPASFLPKTR